MTTLRKGQTRLGPQTWAIIREAYLSGTSAAALAQAYGCSLGTIRYRAVREGWRRCDAEGAPMPIAAEPDGPPPSPEALADAAMSAAMRAVRGGRPSEATAYVRVAEAARRLGGPRGDAVREDPDDDVDDGEPESIDDIYRDLEERLAWLTAIQESRRTAETGG